MFASLQYQIWRYVGHEMFLILVYVCMLYFWLESKELLEVQSVVKSLISV